MRKVIVSMNITLDGYLSGLNCELDWHFQRWNAEMGHVMSQHLQEADTIVLGRVTYQVMAKHWPSVIVNLSYPVENIDFAKMMNTHAKVVFSKTLTGASWQNSSLVKGEVKEEILQLKRSEGKDIIVYGSGKLVESLMQLGLIDEYRIWVHPVLLGEGKQFFKKVQNKANLKFLNSRTFTTGVVLLTYECEK